MADIDITSFHIPDVSFKERIAGRWQTVTTKDIFSRGKILVFSLPGAFTPTCSNKQLPNFARLYEEFKSKGIDEIYCLSVNDAFVMNAWFDSLKITNVKPISDGNGHFTRRMGQLINKTHLGMGMRSWRYVFTAQDMAIVNWWEEPGINDKGEDDDPYGETDPENVLKSIRTF